MADSNTPEIFLSYARSAEPHAKTIAEALRGCGYSVWWDDDLPAHRAYSDVIEERLNSAKAVLVVWSREGAKSEWVRAEADAARHDRKLVQLSIDGVMPPMPFNQIQCPALQDWAGSTDTPAWRKIEGSIAELVRGERPAQSLGEARGAPSLSICVLPFVNMSGDSDQEYFSDGITEDLITDLSKISALGVVARNTSFTYKGKSVEARSLGRELDVSHILEGSVRKSGNRLRITAQLIDTANGQHQWAERYDRELADIFDIQDELSRAIVDALKLKLLPSEKKAIEQRGTENAEAYNLYLMARQHWATGNDGDSRRDQIVLRLCRRAIDIDPNYARAWALMALTQAWMRFRDEKVEDAGLEAADKALELDPRLPEPHCVRAGHFARQGLFEQANEEIAIALQLDPNSWEANREGAIIAFRQGRLEEALPLFEKATSLMETDYRSAALLMSCGMGLGDKGAARRGAEMAALRAERVVAQDGGNAAALAYGAGGLAHLGERDRAKEWMRQATLLDPDNIVQRYNLACAAALNLDDVDTAIDYLEPFMDKATPYQIQLAENDPDLSSVRDDPRFQRMLGAAKARLSAAAAIGH